MKDIMLKSMPLALLLVVSIPAFAEPILVEAEDATKSSGVTTEADELCSGGKRVGYVGKGRTLTFTVRAEEEGLYQMTSYYMTRDNRRMEIVVGGEDTYKAYCPKTGAWDGTAIGTVSTSISLKAGSNTIVVGNASADAPNLDKFEFLYIGEHPDEEPPVDMSDALACTSPGGILEVRVKADDKGRAVYAVTRAGEPLLMPSRLGFEGRTFFASGIVEHSQTEVDEPFDLMHGRTSHADNHYTELRATFQGSTEAERLTVVFRIFDDAVALRYEMAEGSLTHFEGERTEFNFATFQQALAQEHHKCYEGYYELRPWDELVASAENRSGFGEPMLVQTSASTYALLTEACHTGQHAACKIVQGSKEGSLRLALVATNDADTVSAITYPFASSWRTLIVGSLPDIVESSVVQALNPAPTGNFSWVKPGRVAWNWAEETGRSAYANNTRDINVAKRYVDLAEHLGWEYVLIDDGWENNINLATFVRYARQHGVDVLVWYNNNKFSETYSECVTKLRNLASQGVKGVKIDFFDDDKQATIKKYQTILRAAAVARLMVDFHGSTRPTGWERTYPNLMTMEAVLGGEMLLSHPDMTQADHAANLVLSRNAIGPMDFTPIKLAQRSGSLKTHANTAENPYTTWSYQLATWTLFESGLQCLIDCPDNIIDSPIEPVLRQVPVTWDETRLLEAEPAKYATLARDGTCTFDIAFQKRTVTSATTLSLAVKANGGATVIITTDENRPCLRATNYEAESAAGGTKKSSEHCSGGYYKTVRENASLKFSRVKADGDGEYAVTLYYMLPDEGRRAYIQVGDDGEKAYYDFHSRDEFDQSKGLVLGMKTVYVQLKEGTNIICYGCEDGVCPDLDRITVAPTKETQDLIDGISLPDAKPTNTDRALRLEGDCIVCSTFDGGTLSIFDLNGHLLQKTSVEAGEERIKLLHLKESERMPFIASLNVGTRAFARKFLIQK